MEEIVRNEVANEVANEVKKSIFGKAIDLVKDNKVVAITSGVIIAGGTAFLLWRNSKKKKAANQDKGNKPTPAVENTKPGNKPEETKEEKKEEESK